MTKSSTTKVAARKARHVAKAASQVPTRKTDNTQPKSAVSAAAERPKEKGRKTAASKIAFDQLHDSHRKTAPKIVAEKTRDTDRKAAREIVPQHPKAVADKTRDAHRRASPNIATEQLRDTRPMAAAKFEELRDAQVPDSMRELVERNVAQTRELYGRSKNALQSVLEIWGKSFGPAGQGAVTLNRKIMDIADRNISSGFDLAESLAGARNLPEALELQAAYWRNLLGELQTQTEEVRALATKVAADVVKPIKNN